MDSQTERAAARVGLLLKEKWRLDALIGVGGMAAVYAATHRNGKRVAIKMLHPEISFDTNIRQRFLREGYVANAVGHRGAVAVDDDDVADDGSAFLVMELLDGETLDARAERKGGKLPPSEVLSLCDQVLDTLAAAHEHGIVHRDLKPENLFLTRDGAVKVLDFGIARIRELSGGNNSATQTGSLMGTPAFMPPEQARSRWNEVDARTDIWAMGATMFNLLTGKYVHEAETATEALAMAVMSKPRSLAAMDPSMPPLVIEIVDTALASDKGARWPDAAAMQNAIRAAYHALDANSGGATDGAENEPLPPVESSMLGVPVAAVTLVKTSTGPGVSATLARSPGSADVRQTGAASSKGPPRAILAATAVGLVALVGLVVVFGGSANRHAVTPSPEPAAVTAPQPTPVQLASAAAVATDAPVVAPAPTPPPIVPEPTAAPPAAVAPAAPPVKTLPSSAADAHHGAKAKATVAPEPSKSPAPVAKPKPKSDDPFAGRF